MTNQPSQQNRNRAPFAFSFLSTANTERSLYVHTRNEFVHLVLFDCYDSICQLNNLFSLSLSLFLILSLLFLLYITIAFVTFQRATKRFTLADLRRIARMRACYAAGFCLYVCVYIWVCLMLFTSYAKAPSILSSLNVLKRHGISFLLHARALFLSPSSLLLSQGVCARFFEAHPILPAQPIYTNTYTHPCFMLSSLHAQIGRQAEMLNICI